MVAFVVGGIVLFHVWWGWRDDDDDNVVSCNSGIGLFVCGSLATHCFLLLPLYTQQVTSFHSFFLPKQVKTSSSQKLSCSFLFASLHAHAMLPPTLLIQQRKPNQSKRETFYRHICLKRKENAKSERERGALYFLFCESVLKSCTTLEQNHEEWESVLGVNQLCQFISFLVLWRMNPCSLAFFLIPPNHLSSLHFPHHHRWEIQPCIQKSTSSQKPKNTCSAIVVLFVCRLSFVGELIFSGGLVWGCR